MTASGSSVRHSTVTGILWVPTGLSMGKPAMPASADSRYCPIQVLADAGTIFGTANLQVSTGIIYLLCGCLIKELINYLNALNALL